MYIGDSSLTGKIDNLCMEKYGFSELILMENASTNAVNRILRLNVKMDNIIVICGTGNNGGDGLTIARKLTNKGYKVDVFIIGNIDKLSPSSATNYQILKNYNTNITLIDENNVLTLIRSLFNANLVIDCIFGSGLNRDVKGVFYEVISSLNEEKKEKNFKVVSIDIPSGLNGSSGEVMNISVIADYTITFEFFKIGFLRYDTKKYTGQIFVESIDIPREIYKSLDITTKFIDDEFVKNNLINKASHSHKGDFGRVFMFAGSRDYTGAAYISTQACVKTGSGLTTLISSKNVVNILQTKFVEAMSKVINDRTKDEISKSISKADCIGFGPGLGNNNYTEELLEFVLDNSTSPIVLDADGINVLSNKSYLQKTKNKLVITPHLGEFSRLIGIDIKEIQKNRIGYASDYARQNNVILVLKGENTVITNGYSTLVSTSGNSSMANGGMGDCLTGIITSLIGQGYEPFMASAIGVYIHGKCGDEIAKYSQVVNASDILEILPKVLKNYYNDITLS